MPGPAISVGNPAINELLPFAQAVDSEEARPIFAAVNRFRSATTDRPNMETQLPAWLLGDVLVIHPGSLPSRYSFMYYNSPFQVAPFHTLQQLVYHTNTACPEATRIAPIHHRVGTGGKVACLCCRHLNRTPPRTRRRVPVVDQQVAG